MIFTIASDADTETVAFDGRSTGRAVRCIREPYDLKKSIAVAILRIYLDYQPGAKRLELSGYDQYYIVNLPATLVLEVATRACHAAGTLNGVEIWDTAETFAQPLAEKLEIMSFAGSYDEMMEDLDDLHQAPHGRSGRQGSLSTGNPTTPF